jgi:mRNA interferase MazF
MTQRRTPRGTNTQFPRLGEIFDVSLDPVVGSEIGKRRPALVVSNDVNNQYAQTVTVVPLTGQPSDRNYPFEVLIPRGVAGLTSDSRAKCNQVRTIDKSRLVASRAMVTAQYISEVKKALKNHLDLG